MVDLSIVQGTLLMIGWRESGLRLAIVTLKVFITLIKCINTNEMHKFDKTLDPHGSSGPLSLSIQCKQHGDTPIFSMYRITYHQLL